MPIPKYDEITLPFLEILSDQKEHTLREIIDLLAAQFLLSVTEKAQLLPSGQQPVFDNRVGWARTYMKKAGLLESAKRAHFRITVSGLELLQSKPKKIDADVLAQYPEFREFISPKREPGKTPPPEPKKYDDTPLEKLENAFLGLQQTLAHDLLEQVLVGSSSLFERIVVDLLVQMGYGGNRKDAAEAVGRSGDEGIDGIIKEDPLGLDTIYVQAKRWRGTVGRPELHRFAGALQGQRAKKGIFVTTSDFSKEAQDYAKNIEPKIVLIDGRRLTDLMIEHNVGVTLGTNYQLKRVDSDYFSED